LTLGTPRGIFWILRLVRKERSNGAMVRLTAICGGLWALHDLLQSAPRTMASATRRANHPLALRLIGSQVKPSPQKYLLSVFRKNMIICRSSRLHQEGRIAIVTDVGSGQRWTPSVADERHARRTVKSCGPGPPTLGSSLAKTFGRATGANKPAPRGEREAAVKTIAQGTPAVSAALWFLACAECTLFCTQGSRVRPASGVPCALLFHRGRRMMHHPGRITPREYGRTSSQ